MNQPEKIKVEHDELQVKIRDAYKQQKYSQCVKLIEASSESVKCSAQYKILKVSCLNNIGGRSLEAHAILDDVINLKPSNAFAHYGKGLVFINDGKLSESLKCFEKAIEIDPSEKMSKARQMQSRAENMMRSIKLEKVKEERFVNGLDPLERKPRPVKFKKEPTTDEPKIATKNCEICFKAFTKGFSLNRHMLLHTGQRPFKCEICGFGFIQKSDLNRHLSTHSDAMNFPCSQCEKKVRAMCTL